MAPRCRPSDSPRGAIPMRRRRSARNYRPGDVVGFHRPYKRLGVEKGDELRVAGVDGGAGTVMLAGTDGGNRRLGARPARGSGGRRRGLQGRVDGAPRGRPHTLDPQRCRPRARQQPDRRGDGGRRRPGELPARGRAHARHDRGRIRSSAISTAPGPRPCMRSRGRTVDSVIAAIEANHPNLTNQKMLYVEISRARGPGRARDRRQGGAQGAARGAHRRADRGARSARRGQGPGLGDGRGKGSRNRSGRATTGYGTREGSGEDAGAEDRGPRFGAVAECTGNDVRRLRRFGFRLAVGLVHGVETVPGAPYKVFRSRCGVDNRQLSRPRGKVERFDEYGSRRSHQSNHRRAAREATCGTTGKSV